MNLKDIGEFGFINRFAGKFNKLVSNNSFGIGDDCAIIPINDKESYVVTTDLLVEDIHFIKDEISAKELGYKSLAVNLSDIAGMGAEPRFSFLSIAVPKNTPVEYLDDFMLGYYNLSEKYSTALMGGDTTKSPDKIIINVSVIGICKNSEIRLRSMAKTGDIICVTGNLGDSGGGLNVLLNKIDLNEDTNYLVNKHHLPEPKIKEGRWLTKNNYANALMDISDGISSDLEHILEQSNKSASVDINKIPISQTLKKISDKHGWNALELACSGGEDYELLFTVDKNKAECLCKDFLIEFGKPISIIGEITDGENIINWTKNNSKIDIKHGFNHFAE